MIDLAHDWRIDGGELELVAFGVLARWSAGSRDMPGGEVRIFDRRERVWRRDERISHSLIEATERVAALVAMTVREYERAAEAEQRMRERERNPDRPRTSECDRAEKYLAKCDPSIAGAGGAHRLMTVVGLLAMRFPGLDLEDRISLLVAWDGNNQPPWGAREIKRAVRNAHRRQRR